MCWSAQNADTIQVIEAVDVGAEEVGVEDLGATGVVVEAGEEDLAVIEEVEEVAEVEEGVHQGVSLDLPFIAMTTSPSPLHALC